MEIKLKSTLSQIPWWLVCRAGLAALTWWWFPFWVFFLVVNYFYWVPFFEVRAFLVPFLFLLGLGFVSPPGWWGALGIALIFFLILGVKELLFVQRTHIYEILSLLVLFFGVFYLAYFIQEISQIDLPFLFFFAGIFFFALRESAFRYAEQSQGAQGVLSSLPRQRFIASVIPALLFWEYGVVLGGLALDPIPRAGALFAGAAAFFLLTPYKRAMVPPRLFGRYVGAFLLGILLILITSSWTL